jgi:uncharacterized protein (TIGR03083 family)
VDASEAQRWLARESEEFASVVDAGRLDSRVPGCPDWTLRSLAWHLGRVQQFWAMVIRAGADVEPASFDEGKPDPSDAPELAAWMRASTQDLLDALHTHAPEQPAWTWWRDDRTVGAIARHQVQEAAVHRWDAQSAVGTPLPLDPSVADDGVGEFVGIARQLRPPAPITFVATDTERSFPASSPPFTVTVSATASDLVLLLYGRVAPADVRVDGDRSVLSGFLEPVE